MTPQEKLAALRAQAAAAQGGAAPPVTSAQEKLAALRAQATPTAPAKEPDLTQGEALSMYPSLGDLGKGLKTAVVGVADNVLPAITGAVAGGVGALGNVTARIEQLLGIKPSASPEEVESAITKPWTDLKWIGRPGTEAGQAVQRGAGEIVGGTLDAAKQGLQKADTALGTGTVLQDLGGTAGEAIRLAGSIVPGVKAAMAPAKVPALSANAAKEQSLNAPRMDALEGTKYSVPPTATNPGMVNTAIESMGGKAATRQVMRASNALETNRLVREDLGIPHDKPITKEALEQVRRDKGQTYAAVKKSGEFKSDEQFLDDLKSVSEVSDELESQYPGTRGQVDAEVGKLVNSVLKDTHDAKGAVELTKILRNRAKTNFQAASTGDPLKRELAKAQLGVSDAVEDLIKRHLEKTGQGDLAVAWDEARTTIAKSHQVEAALKGNNVDAGVLRQQFRKNRPLSGGMEKIARFADQFPEVAGVPESGAGAHNLLGMLAGGGAAAELLWHHNPKTAAAIAAGGAVPYALRKAVASGPGQQLLARPSYEPGVLRQATNSPALRNPAALIETPEDRKKRLLAETLRGSP